MLCPVINHLTDFLILFYPILAAPPIYAVIYSTILLVIHQFTTFINEILVAQSVVLKHS